MASEPSAQDLIALSRTARITRLLHQLLRKPAPLDVLRKRERVRDELQEHIGYPESKKPREAPEVIVVDLKRFAEYPKYDDRIIQLKPWLWSKCEVKTVDDDALEIYAGWHKVRIKGKTAREVSAIEEGDQEGVRKVCAVGRMRLDRIDHVDWKADPVYGSPRIYARFGWQGPFDEVVLYEEMDGLDPAPLIRLWGLKFKPRRYSLWFRLKFNWEARKQLRE